MLLDADIFPQAKRQAALDKEEQRLQRQGLNVNWEIWLPCIRKTMIEYDKPVDWGAPPPKKRQTHMEEIHYISLSKTQVQNNQTADAFW